MKHLPIIIVLFMAVFFRANGQQTSSFDIFSYEIPAGFQLKENTKYLYYYKNEGRQYCQLFLYPAVAGAQEVQKDFNANWDLLARNPSQKVAGPESKRIDSLNEWRSVSGMAKGVYGKQLFTISISTFSKGDITYCTVTVYSDKKFEPAAAKFRTAVKPFGNKFVRAANVPALEKPVSSNTITPGSQKLTKYNTNFDDGWYATALSDFVKVTKGDMEVQLRYIDPALDDARPNTTDAPSYYWSKYVEPYYTVSAPQKWSGVEYPVIYHMQGQAIEKKTGRSCFVAIKIVYSGGARPIVVVAANENNYRQQFPHPNDIDRMLTYNKFALTLNDITGIWKGGGGGSVDYFNVLTDAYAYTHAISTTDEFTFNADGTYKSVYRSANMNGGSTQFGGQDFAGPFRLSDWSITASNRLGGKTTVYNAQLIAVKNGYLLYMSDSDNASMNYTLFKSTK